MSDGLMSYNEIFGSILEEKSSLSDYVGALLGCAGEYFHLSYVAVKRVFRNQKAMYCANEWSALGTHELLNVEVRFLDSIWDSYMAAFSSSANGVFTYASGDDARLLRIIDSKKLKSLVEVPAYVDNEFYGCVDFACCTGFRDFSEDEVNILKQLTDDIFAYYVSSELLAKKDIKNKDTEGYDPITHLPKYEQMVEHVREAVKQNKNCRLITTCSDFSNFKFLNEKYGYNVGNEILHRFAVHIFKDCGFIVGACRSHSDNFITVSHHDCNITDEEILEYSKAVGRAFSDLINKYYFDANLVMNMGIAELPLEPGGFETSITRANIARKIAKQDKSDKGVRCMMFEQKMQDDIHIKASYVADFNKAFENNEIKVMVQPVVTTDSMIVTGGEALIRWNKPDGSVIYPEQFLEAFEKDGCILKLDYFVCEEVFKFLYGRYSQGLPIHSISINLSYLHKDDPKFIPFIKRLKTLYPFPSDYVIFEFHESIYTDNTPASKNLLDSLRSMHYGIMIDKFGIGYSSLNAITRYRIAGIKLDRAFMKREMDNNTKIVLESIIALSEELGLLCSCTGVETEEQRQFAIDSGCKVMQGYYYSKPLSFEDFGKLLNTSEIGSGWYYQI